MQQNMDGHGRNLSDLVKNVLLGFCKINVAYAEHLDIYGSLHIRADNRDVANFMLNEHFQNSRASSPTVTSAQQADQELVGNGNNSQSTGRSPGYLNHVKTEVSFGTEENQNDLHVWQWSDTESSTAQCQQDSFLQPSCGATQPVSAWSGNLVSHDSGAVSIDSVSAAVSNVESCVKVENSGMQAAASDDQLSNDGVVEILDDDSDDCTQDTDFNETTKFMKSEYLKTEEAYEAEMPFEYEDFAHFGDSSAAQYQYPNVSTYNYPRKRPPAAYAAKRFKLSASFMRQNVPSTSEKICEYCQERFVSDAELSAHFQQYHQCTVPQQSSQQRKRKTLVHHIPQNHESELVCGAEGNVVKMFKCRFCQQIFKSLDGLKNHENVKHSRTRCYKCSFCSQEFLTRQSAYIHRVKFHRLLVRKTQ